MYAPKIAGPQSKLTRDSADLLKRRGSGLLARGRMPEAEKSGGGTSPSATGFTRDFSSIRTRATGDGAMEATIPVATTIQSSGPGRAAKSKASHDEAGAEASAETGAEPAAQEVEPTPAVEREDDALYIAQMGGEPAIKDTSADSVSATFAYSGAPSRGGVTVTGDDFGITSGSVQRFSNVSVTPGTGKFTVTADLKQTIKWETRATLGPKSQVSIASETDAALTSANYTTAASDLTPDLSDLKGRPPRTKFWAKDLTEKHEKFHADERVDIAKAAATDAEAWLATQSAARKEDVPALLTTAWNDKVFKTWDKKTDPPGVEERAYDNGAASYKARADAIKAKGDKGAAGGYPAPATP
jgi:hypothetical protein